MLLPQTHSSEVDYPLHHGDDGGVVGEDRDHAGSAPPEFSPSNVQLQAPVSWFCVFAVLLSETRRGTIFIVGFSSIRRRGEKDL